MHVNHSAPSSHLSQLRNPCLQSLLCAGLCETKPSSYIASLKLTHLGQKRRAPRFTTIFTSQYTSDSSTLTQLFNSICLSSADINLDTGNRQPPSPRAMAEIPIIVKMTHQQCLDCKIAVQMYHRSDSGYKCVDVRKQTLIQAAYTKISQFRCQDGVTHASTHIICTSRTDPGRKAVI